MKTYLFIALLLLLAACELVGITGRADGQEDLIGTWRLTAFEEADGTETDVGSEPLIVTFQQDSTLTGHGEQNSFGGKFEVEEEELTITTYGSTLAGIPEGSRYLEFIAALRGATSYEVGGNQLRIVYDGGKALIFEQERSR